MKKAILTLLMIPAFVGMLFSCSEVKTDAKKLEGKWNIVEVKGEKILKEGLPNMEFDMKDNKVHGNAGCNIFNSTVVLDDQDISSITINPAAITMMACPDMEIEDAILKAMGNVKGVKAGKVKITLNFASGTSRTVTITVQKKKVATSKITVSERNVTLKVKGKRTLMALISPITSKDKVTYKTSNKKIATVNNAGKVTGKKAGKAKITVRSGKKKFTVTVTVTK